MIIKSLLDVIRNILLQFAKQILAWLIQHFREVKQLLEVKLMLVIKFFEGTLYQDLTEFFRIAQWLLILHRRIRELNLKEFKILIQTSQMREVQRFTVRQVCLSKKAKKLM